MSHARKLALCSVLLMMASVFSFAVPANAAGWHRFNVFSEYSSPFTAHPSNQTYILTGCGCKIKYKRTRKAGGIRVSPDGESVYFRFKPGEKVVLGEYTIKYVIEEVHEEEGQEFTDEKEGVKNVPWNGKRTLPLRTHKCLPERCEHTYLKQVTAFALLPHHPPYAKVRLEEAG